MKTIPLCCAVLLAGCSLSLSPKPSSVIAVGTLHAGESLTVDAGVSDVSLRLGTERDSVRWSLRVDPPGCARADVSPTRLAITDRARHCATAWDVSVPAIADVRVDVSVGDITLSAPSDRAIRLHAGVGSVKLRLDGRELHHDGAPGSGDKLELGEISTRPRLVAHTGVGSVTIDLRTPR